MWLTERRIDILSRYFADLSKIVIAAAVVGFFIPTGTGPVTPSVFAGGLITASAFLVFSLALSR